MRNLWFDEFKKKFSWDEAHDNEIRKVFEFRGSQRLKGMTFEIRKTGRQPVWMNKEVYDGLCKYWTSDAFTSKSEMGKTNRASPLGVGSSLHCGGSIPHSVHKSRLRDKLGREPTLAEQFVCTHLKKDSSWVDTKSKESYETYIGKIAEIQSAEVEASSTSPTTSRPPLPEQLQKKVWEETIGLTKKGKIYGFGLEGSCASSTGPPCTSKNDTLLLQKERKSKKKKLKKRLSRVEEQLLETNNILKTLLQQINCNIPMTTSGSVDGATGSGSKVGNENEDEDDDEDKDEEEEEQEQEDEDNDDSSSKESEDVE